VFLPAHSELLDCIVNIVTAMIFLGTVCRTKVCVVVVVAIIIIIGRK
jgi:hypothetical protein